MELRSPEGGAGAMLARLQQALTLSLAAAACAWLWFWWPHSPGIALAGFVAPAVGYAAILAIEFVALRFLAAPDPVPRARWGALLRAWIGEVFQGPRVFCWRQPFRSNSIPDFLPSTRQPGKRGVVLIHGFVCNRGFWAPWLKQLRALGHPFVAVNLEPVFGSIDEYVSIVDAAVQRVEEATGMPPDLLCHSMGGLAARAWLRSRQADARVRRVITIATPHGGTWLGRFSRLTNGRQMHLSSEWLEELGRYGNESRNASFTCWYSDCDNIVFPVSTATLPGADNRLIHGAAHVALAFRPELMRLSLAQIAG